MLSLRDIHSNFRCIVIPGAVQRGEDLLAALRLRQPPDENVDGAIQRVEKPETAEGFAQKGQFLTHVALCVCRGVCV